jgi:hypothetical protein
MVASSSRLIAFLGLRVILCLYLGFGYVSLWDRFFKPEATIDARNLLALFGGATMFAPYLANQLNSAFSSYTSPQQSPPQQAPQQLLLTCQPSQRRHPNSNFPQRSNLLSNNPTRGKAYAYDAFCR